MSTSPPNFPAGSCSSFPVRASVCFQPVSPCDVRLPPLLSRQPQLPVKSPPPVCRRATWLFHKGYWNNSAPRRKWQSVQKTTALCGGLVQYGRCFIVAYWFNINSVSQSTTQVNRGLCCTSMPYLVNCKHPSQGVTIFTLSIFTVMLTVIVIWPQWEWVNFQPSEAVKVPALPLYVTRRTPLIFQSYVCGSNDEIMEWYLWKIRCEVCACAGSYQLVDEPLDKTDTLCATERKYLLGPL